MTVIQSAFICATSLCFAMSAQAATVFTSKAAFLSTLRPGSYTESFTNPASNPNASLPLKTLTSGAFSYTITGSPGGLYEEGTFIGNWAGAQELVITFTTGNITAVGGEFYITNFAGNFQTDPVTVTLSDGTVETWSPASVATFRGFTSPGVPITSLTLRAPAASRFNNIDNLIVGSAVPEPSCVGLLAGALVPLMRRKRRATLAPPAGS